LSSKENSKIVKKNDPYTWIGEKHFKLGPDQFLRRYAREDEVYYILSTCHDGPYGDHFSTKRKTYKILHAGFY